MYNTSEIAKLIRKKLEGNISAQELLILDDWVKNSTSNAELLQRLENEEGILDDVRIWFELPRGEENEGWHERLESKTFTKINKTKTVRFSKVRERSLKFLPYAASLIIASLIGYFYFGQISAEAPLVLHDLEPGSTKALVTFSDGRVIELNENQGGIVLGEHLTYQDGSLISQFEETIVYSELTTPKGGHYHITLSDGTKVWLNADSKLKYPSRFEGGQRTVEVVGEAYFEVASSYTNTGRKIPFIVKNAQQEIEVLGTQFNVMAYAEDAFVQTTLVEGSVKIRSGDKILLLNPGEQSVVEGESINKRNVEIDQYVGWKNNEFVFHETELNEGLKMLSRWYDFDVVYEDTMPDTHLYGTISKENRLTEALKIMKSSGLKFRIEKIGDKNRLIVLK